jgi:1-pyrroline-5-carboxylate dehydrogenase
MSSAPFDGNRRPAAITNEPIRSYAPGSPERAALKTRLAAMEKECPEIPLVIGGKEIRTGDIAKATSPHKHGHVTATWHKARTQDVQAAIKAAGEAQRDWSTWRWEDRAAILLKAAELLATTWRPTMAAATMLGQSKTAFQAEIDATCELIDFWRYNVHFARRLLAEQPTSAPGSWNRLEYRPLEGFVLAITPFNFTSIAGNLPTAPALLGNVVIWKPSHTQQFSAHFLMRLLEAAGLPPGVINMVTGGGRALSRVALPHRDLAGIHFTGSTGIFQHLWRTVGENISGYRSYPRLVGETGGKDFVIAHPSADPDVLRTALVRGAFEYQGQKCSAASRAYVPRSVWRKMGDDFIATVEALTMGDVSSDLSVFMGAVIDDKAFATHADAIDRARSRPSVSVLAGGTTDATHGYFVRPTVLESSDPTDELFTTEYFGPILGVHVFDDADYDAVVTQAADIAPYALTGSIIATDRAAIAAATRALRFSAGNFYVNDKPTGAVVGQQPFGGARASGTNDKAGSIFNLTRWVNARTIKEMFAPPTDYRYPHMG